MEETINLKELFQTLKKRLWLIALITIIAAIISAVISFFVITPIYESKTQILVNQTKSDQQLYTGNEVQTNVQLINTYNVIIKSPVILDRVKDELNLDRSVENLNSQITVSSATNSQVVEITVKDPSPHLAAQIANKTAEVFKNQVSEIMKVDNVSVLSKAEIKDDVSPVKPQPLLNIAIAIIVGLMVGVGLAFLLEYLDNTIKTEQDIESILELPVMGAITNIKEIPRSTNVVARAPLNTRSQQRGETYGS
ncbi:YveK family protein [Priestia megaterium]|uniref:YveK family protein n=1 Tax=Priestia megaterium TaxID=1404 RepID=UPI000D5158CF|nr:Wzz/FepE/Etk N-terminal domain-containing protein [Priestia megaterium]PVE67186.1 capsular biosynthesis protein [Priestia megaterium]PVE84288.1 capsular biosynthesis protein [Priestia megaterium]PVE91391.1 capsular biosynthesis protein [Priestia megaterium]PVE93918.1 capsular biosynthesis protein [Priestia megaterium]